MSLGERIASLRAGMGMSQGELAGKLGVSRQSVSKWETNGSVPELDRLIQLADIFGVTLDALAGRESAPAPERPAAAVIKRPPARIIAGAALLAAGLLWSLLQLSLTMTLPVLGLYMALCGALCLLIRRHAGLVIGWLTMAALILFTSRFTAVRMLGIFRRGYLENVPALAPVLAAAMWLCLAALVFFTVRAAKRSRK